MNTRPHIPLALLLALGLLSGCGKSGSNLTSPGTGPSGSAAEEAEVSSVLASAPEIVEDAEYESPEAFSTTAMAGGDAGTLEAIRPLRWWRNIRSVERRFTFAFADTDSTGLPTTAIVTIHKRLAGNLVIVAGDAGEGGGDGIVASTLDTAAVRLIRKPIQDHWVRRVLLKRIRDGRELNATRGRWRVVASSGVEVTSRGATTDIQSLRVQAANLDTTVTDPLAFWRLRRLIKVNAQEAVTLTATTGASDNLLFLFSRGGRFRFHNNGDGTYTGTWKAPLLSGIRHVGVNAFSNGTLFDDTEPYDSNAWILPYVVMNDALCDYLPNDMR